VVVMHILKYVLFTKLNQLNLALLTTVLFNCDPDNIGELSDRK